jgi:iron(III) transport system substrate-binding protein
MTSVWIETPTGSGARASLKAYSSFEPYELADYLAALAKALPDLAITVERMPTAVLIERLLYERHAPRADMILGWADTAAQIEDLQGICPEAALRYIRPTGFSTAFVVDPEIANRSLCGADVRCWTDLADTRLKGRVAFPDPAISGAGFLALTTLIQFYGETEGWNLIEGICQNVAVLPGSAWEPAALTGAGTIGVGVTVRIAATRRVSELCQLVAVEPADVVGVEAEVYGGLTGTRHPEAVADVLGWINSAEASRLFDKHKKTNLTLPHQNLFTIDARRAVSERPRLITRFRSMFDHLKGDPS